MSQPIPLSVKVRRNDELRRFTFEGPAFTYASLENQVRVIFALQPVQAVVLKYRDNENDLVTVSSDLELSEAIRICAGPANLLRLELTTPAAKPTVAPAKTVAAPKAASAPSSKPAPAPVPASTIANATPTKATSLPVVASAVTPGGPTAAPAPVVAPTAAPAATAPALTVAQATAPTAVPVVDSKQAKQAALVAEKARKVAERERLLVLKEHQRVAKEALMAEQAKKKEEDRKEALRKTEANEKGTTDSPHVHVQLLTAELERVKGELKAAREEKKNADAPLGKALMWGRFVRDVSVPDGTSMQPNETFVKTWRFRNELDRPWPVGTRLLFVGKNSDRLGAPDEVLIAQQLKPTEEIDISVPLVAPSASGRYTAYFRLAGPEGKKFGQRVWVMISVAGANSDEENDNEAQPSVEMLAPFRTQLDVLAQLHFNNNAANLRLLRRFNGSMEDVVTTLMKRRAKRIRMAQQAQTIAIVAAPVASTAVAATTATSGATAQATPVPVSAVATCLPPGPVPIPVPASTPLPAIASASLSNPKVGATPSAQVDH